jgi:hypothetical protein
MSTLDVGGSVITQFPTFQIPYVITRIGDVAMI